MHFYCTNQKTIRDGVSKPSPVTHFKYKFGMHRRHGQYESENKTVWVVPSGLPKLFTLQCDRGSPSPRSCRGYQRRVWPAGAWKSRFPLFRVDSVDPNSREATPAALNERKDSFIIAI